MGIFGKRRHSLQVFPFHGINRTERVMSWFVQSPARRSPISPVRVFAYGGPVDQAPGGRSQRPAFVAAECGAQVNLLFCRGCSIETERSPAENPEGRIRSDGKTSRKYLDKMRSVVERGATPVFGKFVEDHRHGSRRPGRRTIDPYPTGRNRAVPLPAECRVGHHLSGGRGCDGKRTQGSDEASEFFHAPIDTPG